MVLEGIEKIAVIGAGIMGHGIAQLLAQSGYKVNLVDIKEEILQKAMEKISWSLNKLVDKKIIAPHQRDDVVSSIKTYTGLKEALKDVDFVIETIVEDEEIKKKVFKEVSDNVAESVIISSNTSDIRISKLATAVDEPERFVGMHFLNPPVLMPLIEVVMGEKTNMETAQKTKELAESLGKITILIKKDRDLADILRALAFEVVWQVQEGKYTVEEIDASFRKEGFPMGQLELMDFGGLDTVYNVMKHHNMDIPPVFEEKIKAGELGQKTGKGFYDWSKGRPKIDLDKAGKFDVIKALAPWVNEAVLWLAEDIAEKEEIDKAWEMGQGFPYGPFKFADLRGIDNIVEELKASPRGYKPNPLLLKMVEEGNLGKKTRKGFYDYGAGVKRPYINIIVETDEELGISTITINRPQRMNAMNHEAIDEFKRALDELSEAGKTRCLVIKGAKPAFSTGADLGTEFAEADSVLKLLKLARGIKELMDKIEAFTCPVVAAIDGYALGGGCELAMACDTRVASERSELGLPEVGLGALPGAGGTQRLIRLIGLSRAKDMVLRGEWISAEKAYEWGLVNVLCKDEEFEEKVMEVAEKYASGAPIAQHMIKYLMNLGSETPLNSALEMETLGFSLLVNTEDIDEGISAFREKRKAKFKGK
ncbi:MAG: 3-hydroxyacyl-CoA dehydrogenase/enoyl-CoA hydratase family protein [Candidatus Lokiarchaeia archaeon]